MKLNEDTKAKLLDWFDDWFGPGSEFRCWVKILGIATIFIAAVSPVFYYANKQECAIREQIVSGHIYIYTLKSGVLTHAEHCPCKKGVEK